MGKFVADVLLFHSWFGLRLDALGSVLMMALFLLIVCFRVTAADLLVGGFAGKKGDLTF
jgi:hypothetical protein